MCKATSLIHQFGLAILIVAALQVCIQRLGIKFVYLQNLRHSTGVTNAAEQNEI